MVIDKNEILNEFNKYYVNIGKNISENINSKNVNRLR